LCSSDLVSTASHHEFVGREKRATVRGSPAKARPRRHRRPPVAREMWPEGPARVSTVNELAHKIAAELAPVLLDAVTQAARSGQSSADVDDVAPLAESDDVLALRYEDAGRILGVSSRTVRRLVLEGDLPVV
jgi:hypothetical protein